jgi:predicted nucleic acid-binding protein
MIALDTNLLVYAHRSAVAEHRAAQDAITRAGRHRDGWGISLAVVFEFWCVVTHPAASGRPSTPEEAAAFVTALETAGAQVWMPGVGFSRRMAQLAAAQAVVGSRIFDLQIALTAFEGGATELWTADRRFMSIPGLPVVCPLEA